jgi:tripartite-type tricarboxylate transporter receptor subunit TctC
MASSFVGSPPHLCAMSFESIAGLKMPHVEYRSDGAALIDLLAGNIQVVFASLGTAIPNLGTALEHIRLEKLRAIAVTSSTRSELLPNIPTVGEFVAKYQHSSWFGIGAPKNTPQSIVDSLNKTIGEDLTDPKINAQLIESVF